MFTTIFIPMTLGLAVFLLGMKVMEAALHQWAGRYLQVLLERFTRTPFRGMLASTGITAAMQSSTAVTVITIGLVNAGLMRFPQTLGIILGTNIGTCLTTELIGLNLHKHSLSLFSVSLAVWLATFVLPGLPKYPQLWKRHVRNGALAVLGFSCILLGMQVMQSIIPDLRSRGLFGWFVQQSQSSLLWAMIAGAILTAIVHSGVLTISMAMSLASVQVISPEVGIAITIGANVGTCVTALMASIGGSRFGAYVAWSHILLNVGGAILFYPLIGVLGDVVTWMTDSPSLQVARAQTIFNIACSLIALPLCYTSLIKRLK
ncbi:Na/Pi cotransporter family protein [Paenibacillus sp. J2TS4]|uniref:Na/Pi cotransporter family protein n=1 Tax=Paenibacillus sp. J2TS4 TaxID=2807194 RepID=UPI001B004B32|nr:Na/Pi symporter [Paenibacillus sp. J2TS4]GIP35845.1 Na/Pi-cotransporter [Paenibacillus sp. J2TS4]